jgi:hypothetical protein
MTRDGDRRAEPIEHAAGAYGGDPADLEQVERPDETEGFRKRPKQPPSLPSGRDGTAQAGQPRGPGRARPGTTEQTTRGR